MADRAEGRSTSARDRPALYRNRGDGTFEDVAQEAGIARAEETMSGVPADVDNDGWIDLYLGNGGPQMGRREPHVLYRNRGDGTFADITDALGLGHVGKSHGVALADYDRDGDVDLYVPSGGAQPGDHWHNAFYCNEGFGNDWLAFQLEGQESNRDGIGARVEVRCGERVQMREVASGYSFGNSSSLEAHFGLADCARALVGDRALRTLCPQTLADAQYAQEQALARDSTLAEATPGLAALYQAQGAYEKATVLYRRLVEQNADMGAAYAELGFALAAQGRYRGARRAYLDALRRGERSALLYARTGHAYAALGHVPEHLQSARAAYRAALQLDPALPDVHAHLARVELAGLYRDMGQPQVGRGVLVEGIEREGDVALLHQEMGRFLWEDGHAQRYAALIYSALGRQEEALASYEGLVRLQPADASIQISLGIVHSQRGNWAASEEAFKRAHSLGNDGGDAALKLGGFYVHRGRLRAAVKLFADRAVLHPNNAELHASLGDVYRQLGVLGAARQAGERSVELEPERALWRYHLALIYERAYPQRADAEWQRNVQLARIDAREEQRLSEVEKKWQEKK